MIRKYQIDGIGCGGCVTRVKKTLEAHPSIDKAEISINPKGAAIISMTEVLAVSQLQKQLNKLEGYTITEI